VFDVESALRVLRMLDGRSLEIDAGDGSELLVPLGASTRFLAAVAALADSLVGRGRVLPGVVQEPDGVFARWRPVVAGEDAARLRTLAQAAPAVCRAERVGDDLAGRSAADVLTGMVDALVDGAVRAVLTEAASGTSGAGMSLLPRRRGRGPAGEPVAEKWLAALTAADARIEAAGPQLAELREVLSAWHRSGTAHEGPARTCFRLVEPPEGPDEPWVVEFLLQDTEEPSLVIPAEEVWRGGSSLAAFAKRLEYPQELLLAGLGRASRLWPELENALRTARPALLTMDAAQAHGFLRTTAPMLAQSGFGVLLPSWWHASASKVGLKMTSTSRSAPGAVASRSAIGLDTLVDYRWDLALGEDTLTEEELDALARLKMPLVRFRGQWVELDTERLAAGMKFLERAGAGEMRAGDVLRVGLDLVDEDHGLPISGVEADGWLGDLLSGQAERRLEPIPTPEGIVATLRPYQERGVAWLSFLNNVGLGAVLADDMGLGKTLQTLTLLVSERAGEGPRLKPTLLVCPMSLVGNWQREVGKFAPGLTVHVHHGSDRLTGEEFVEAVADVDLVITTYALAARDVDVLATVDWRRVVLDEAQNIKNSAAKQTRAVRRLRAEHRVALTGTPVENRLSELWSIMEFANPGVLGSVSSFRERFAVPIERYDDTEAAQLLKRVTGPFVLRRLKTDPSIIDDLPDKIEMKVLCNLTAEQASLYQAVVDDMLARIEDSEGMERKGLVLATMAKLKQVCNHPAHLLKDGTRLAGRSGKLARLEEILEEVLAEGDKALCFTQFTEFGDMLYNHLTSRFGREVLYLHGGVPKRRRDEMVSRFASTDGPPVFLLSLKAGGTGLNLTAANHVIHIDRWWNPAVEDQATDRAFRIGQRKNVQVRKFVCVGTLEERIDTMIEQKKALAQMTVGTGESWLTELSVAELRDVVTLSADAVSE
jgi:SNF2 family DNA or RNA helicase